MGGHSKKQTVGYRYFLGLHFVLCHGPIDNISRLTVADRVAWSGTNTGGTNEVNAPSMFGGDDREGGVCGKMDVELGGSSQVQNDYLVSQLGSEVPFYRGVVSVILHGLSFAQDSGSSLWDVFFKSLQGKTGFYIGNNPYLKNFAFRATRAQARVDGTSWPTGLAPAIGQDMNPAAIIYECLTDSVWGMGYAEADCNTASFAAAGGVLLSEGMGMSMTWDAQVPIETFVQEVLKHINGMLYVDQGTGLFTLKLIRNDYDTLSLPVLDETNVSVVSDFARPTVGELVNTVTVQYWDSDTGANAALTVQDIAAQQTQQQVVSTTVKYEGFTNSTIAAKVAARDLLSLSNPFISCVLEGTRDLATLNIGDAFLFNWADYSISGVVMRVVEMAYGTPNSGKVGMKVTQDIYSLGEAITAAPPASEWVEYRSDPQEVLYPHIYEVPYWDVVMRAGEADANAMGELDTGFLVCATKPTPDSLFANLMTSGASGYVQRGTVGFSPAAELGEDIGEQETVFNIDNPTQDVVTFSVGAYIQIDDELMKFTEATDTPGLQVERGVLDTIPAAHSVGTRIYFNGEGSESDGVTYQYNETVSLKLLTTTGKGTLDESGATVYSGVLNDHRQYRPYPPAHVQINGALYPVTIPDTADITVTWATRSRLQLTTETLYSWFDASDFGEESGTTYTVQLLQSNGTLITEQAGLVSVKSATFLLADFSAYTTIRCKIWSERDGYSCLQVFNHQFDRV